MNRSTLRGKYPLEQTKPLKKTIEGVSSYFLILAIVGGFTLSMFIPDFVETDTGFPFLTATSVLIGVMVLLSLLKYIYETFYLKYYFYDLIGKNLVIKKGVFSKNEITLPLTRLQDVYLDQDILDRIFGLYDVHVSSATTISGNLSHIDGLNQENAQTIKKLILTGLHKSHG